MLPYTKIGVVGGIMLGLGRALGETMAVTFVIGNAHQLSTSLFMPGNSIASALANEFTEAVGELIHSSLVELGLILFLITFIVLALPILLLPTRKREGGRPEICRDLYTPPPHRQFRQSGHLHVGSAVRPVLAGLDTVDPVGKGLPGLSFHVFTQIRRRPAATAACPTPSSAAW